MKKQNQTGSAHTYVIIGLIIALAGALGFVFYQNFIAEKDDSPLNDSASEKVTSPPEPSEVKTAEYVDLRKNGEDMTGIVVSSSSDVDQLIGATDALKSYFRTVLEAGGGSTTITIDRIFGDYAAGMQSGAPAYTLWGPEKGDGQILVVAGTQNAGFGCEELQIANVPTELVDEKCLATDGSGLIDYLN